MTARENAPGESWRAACRRVLRGISSGTSWESAHSLLVRDGRLLYKYCRPQRFPKDYLRRYLGASQAAREFRGAVWLKHLGIRCPHPVAALSCFSPLSPFESVLVTEFIDSAGSAEQLLAGMAAGSAEHTRLAATIGRDIGRMARASLLFKDLHLGNVLVTPAQVPCWIDTDVSRVRPASAALDRNRRALARLVDKGRAALGPAGTAVLIRCFEEAANT